MSIHRCSPLLARLVLAGVAALDQGARLFLLQAAYHDWGADQADYYLAGQVGVSHQPLRERFGPLGAWLAAPDDHEAVLLSVATDPAANPARFRAACQAFTASLGRYLFSPSPQVSEPLSVMTGPGEHSGGRG
jgi:hypothetical protein